jgi:hypothetical protein
VSASELNPEQSCDSCLQNHVLPGGTAILEPMAQNWLADDASQAEPLREPTVPPRRQLADEADLEGVVVHATPTLTAGTATAGPHA